jgi:GNAT superfamily N-acetyltransferase
MTELVLRPLRPGDEATFQSMALASWLDAYEGLAPPDMIANAPKMIARALAARFDAFVAAFEGARAVGYYSLGDAYEDRNHLWHLYVDPATQRRGVGTALHAAALDALRARGCAQARLDYVAGNAKAERFYAKHGWTESGREFSDGLELIVMRLGL